MHYLTFFLFALIVSGSVAPHAFSQERVATGQLETTMSWTALQNLIDKASSKADVAQITANSALTKIDKIMACSLKASLYAPDASNADEDGCIPTASSTPELRHVMGAGDKVPEYVAMNVGGGYRMFYFGGYSPVHGYTYFCFGGACGCRYLPNGTLAYNGGNLVSCAPKLILNKGIYLQGSEYARNPNVPEPSIQTIFK